MNRRERRLAERLGVEWVGIEPGGWVEVCLGGPGCGCGDVEGDPPRQAKRAPGPARRSTSAPEPTEEPWPFAG